MVKDDHGNCGGCAAYRNMAVEREQFELLQRRWRSDIVRYDNQTRSKKERGFDFRPILKVPIRGV